MRIGGVCAEADDGRERVALRAQLAVDALQLPGHFGLGRAFAHQLLEACHGGVVRVRGVAHEVALLGALVGARVVHHVGGQHEGACRPALHERDEEARRKVLVAAQRAGRAEQPGGQRKGVLRVVERERGAREVARHGEHLVIDERRRAAFGQNQAQKALARLKVCAGQVLDGPRVADEHLREPAPGKVLHDGFDTRFVHGWLPPSCRAVPPPCGRGAGVLRSRR